MQTRKRSFYESLASTGFAIAYAVPLNWLMINKIVWTQPWLQAASITMVFTITSVVHKYWFRRLFNWIDQRYPAPRPGILDIHEYGSDHL